MSPFDEWCRANGAWPLITDDFGERGVGVLRAAFAWAEMAERLQQARREGDFVLALDLERSERELRAALQAAIRAAKEQP